MLGLVAGRHARGCAVGAEGGIVADAADTATFLTALMRGELLDPPMLAAMQRDAFWSGGEETGCGPAYGHGGAGAGFKTEVWVSGDGSRVAVLLLNGRGDDYADAMARAALQDLYCGA